MTLILPLATSVEHACAYRHISLRVCVCSHVWQIPGRTEKAYITLPAGEAGQDKGLAFHNKATCVVRRLGSLI